MTFDALQCSVTRPTRLAPLAGTKYSQPGLRLVWNCGCLPWEFPATFAAIGQGGADALLVLSDALFNAARREIIGLAAQHRLPTMFEAREFVEDGGLIAYGPNIAEMTRRSASLIVRILKGANPGELPIEQPTTFELTVNVQTGKALGVTIPSTVLLRADKVIE